MTICQDQHVRGVHLALTIFSPRQLLTNKGKDYLVLLGIRVDKFPDTSFLEVDIHFDAKSKLGFALNIELHIFLL